VLDLVTVVVPTRDRATEIADSVMSILANDDANFELFVVDQSEDSDTERVLQAFVLDERCHYIRTSTRGVAAARNVGWRAGGGSLVAYTDDDCRVGTTWVAELRDRIGTAERVGIAFAGVHVPTTIRPGEFAAEFRPHETRYDHSLPGPYDPWGLSANMLVRRSVLTRLSGFDEALGAGGLFRSAAETDLMIRAIASGYTVVNTPQPAVLHLGIRPTSKARSLIEGYSFGLGAAFAKHLRLGSRPGRWLLLHWVVRLSATTAKNILLRRRPLGFAWLEGIIKGAWSSLRTPIDRRTGHYRPKI
jgi:glycosyltransferase involved in cell wall biosynthesis